MLRHRIEVKRRGRATTDDVEACAFAEALVGHCHESGVDNGRMPKDKKLNLLGVDLLAAPADHVLEPAFDRQTGHAVYALELREVASPVEAVAGERFPVTVRGIEVTTDRVRAAATELTLFAEWRFPFGVGLIDPDFVLI